MAIIRKCLGNNQAVIDEAYKHHKIGGHGIGSIPHEAFCDGWEAAFKEYLLTRPSPWISAEIDPEEGLYSCLVKHTQNPEPRSYYFKNGRWQTPGTEVTYYMPIPPLSEK